MLYHTRFLSLLIHANSASLISQHSMPDQKLCHACQAFLQGSCEDQDFLGHIYIHHGTAESFADAINSGCTLCTGLWSEIRLYYRNFVLLKADVEFRTTWGCTAPRRGSSKTRIFTFYYGYAPVELLFEPIELESAPSGKLLIGNSGDEGALSFLVGQYQQCRAQHTNCSRSLTSRTYLPSRLLDIGSTKDECIRLCERLSLDAMTEYATLSHCWGGIQPYTLTKSTAAQLASGVSISAFPKTFRDAFTIVRLLELRFLWIDSLCIFQDDLHDWHIEAGSMKDVYGNAACCIGATAAHDSDTGLFFDRSPRSHEPCIVEATWTENKELPPPGTYWCSFSCISSEEAIDAAPLNRRAWVAQERYLSSRIMHFAKDALFWECLETLGSEACPRGPLTYRHGADNCSAIGLRSLKTAAHKIQRNESLGGSLWGRFVNQYVECRMTKECDCLVALSGIAQHVSKLLGDHLVAGLWRSELLKELCWRLDGVIMRSELVHYRPATWRAPTWSWACSAVIINTNGLSKYDHHSYMATILNVDVEERPSGELIRASLDIRCRLIPVVLNAKMDEDETLWVSASLEGYDKSVSVTMDVLTSLRASNTMDNVWIIALVRAHNKPEFASTFGLVLSRSIHRPKCFERIGMFKLEYYERERLEIEALQSVHDETELQDITIV
ncbi:heterokaryon incompatibility protein-domain-containing protein [Paraphoma chrysanthemicola]|nr:heterokaryon incompatibility protein-domain-containing protein [Paraphoma chrysanthemicola]